MADNFSLAGASILETLSFIAIRTGTPPDLSFTTTLDWRVFSFDPGWDNSGAENSGLGSLLASGDGVLASQTSILSVEVPSQSFIEFSAELGSVGLAAGDYWLAVHVDVSGASGEGDDTALYWAFGYGDGIWAWNRFGSDATTWHNPNSAIGFGGTAFSLTGVPEPRLIFLLTLGLGIFGLRRRVWEFLSCTDSRR